MCSFSNGLSGNKHNIGGRSAFTGCFNKARVRGGSAEQEVSAANSNNRVNKLEGTRDGEDGTSLPGKTRTLYHRVKSNHDAPVSNGRGGFEWLVQRKGESNISGTENIPQTGETYAIVVNSVFSFQSGEGFRNH